MESFQALSLSAVDASSDEFGRVRQVADEFSRRFGRQPMGVARAPGRVNLIGEHVDYEGYSVLPMAIKQSVCVAFGVFNNTDELQTKGVTAVTFDNVSMNYRKVTLSMETSDDEQMANLSHEGASWAKYVLCGVLGINDAYPELFKGEKRELKLLVDGDIPAGCGLSSSSALVVASAMATSGALQSMEQLPARIELAELCRRAEHRVGTMGGGMDQAVACLAQRGVALHLDFASVPAKKSLVTVGNEDTGLTFVVANSLVVAEKAVDAATRFNKRVIECALAAKMVAMRSDIQNWKHINRLVDVHNALETARGERVSFNELQRLAKSYCSLDEYSVQNLEEEFGEAFGDLFKDSHLIEAATAVITSAKVFKLQQRALHVWSEANRVVQFRYMCEALSKEAQPSGSQQELLKTLGELMNASHRSCQKLYECSCIELDSLVDEAMAAGALGARLTGAGWGGCIVALVPKAKVSSFMEAIRTSYYERGTASPAASNAMFESLPGMGADIFTP